MSPSFYSGFQTHYCAAFPSTFFASQSSLVLPHYSYLIMLDHHMDLLLIPYMWWWLPNFYLWNFRLLYPTACFDTSDYDFLLVSQTELLPEQTTNLYLPHLLSAYLAIFHILVNCIFLHLCSCFSKSLNHPWPSYTTSDPSGNLANFIFKIYPDSDHFSSPLQIYVSVSSSELLLQ